jgi:bacterioferritin
MKARPGILEALQEVLTKELTGINQYFLHSRMASNWGYERLAKFQYDESMEEMRHADAVIKRMLMLDGSPNMARYETVKAGKDPLAMLKADLELEERAVDMLRTCIKTTLEQEDHVTRELFEHILADEEEHVDWLETQLAKIEQLGLDHWLAHQQFGEAEHG